MLGQITNSKPLGGWTLKLESADKLPQDLASAFDNLFDHKLGCYYSPAFYVGYQLVNGTNHKLIVQRSKQISGGKSIKDFANVTINIPAGDVRATKASILSEEDFNDFVLRDDIEQGIKKALAAFTGATHKPILELGQQIVKGINYHFICESKPIYPDAEPYLTRLVINNFQDHWIIVEIEKL